ncbi:MAG: helix-turn-helix transcriptional regulator [Comamonas sp.]|uniref:helix-turn-helix transcriptional regulator n=1 Tax=Comamonas sp. TaxID=34028 RepID=UPI002FC97B05
MAQMKDTLRKLRSEKDAKQSTIADALGIAQGTYSSYENGITPPTETCIRIAEYYGVSLEYLLGLSNERCLSGGNFASRFGELHKLAGDHALTSSDVDELLSAAVSYYQNGAPCGDWPLLALRGFFDGLCTAMNAAVAGNSPRLIDGASAATIAALDVTKMPTKFYETKGVTKP